jgi:hypothetical protein
MAKNNYLILFIIFLILSIILGIILVWQIIDKNSENCIQTKAMLFVVLESWNENLDNSNEMFYDYTLYNYGNSEAKNIKITCKNFNEDYEKIGEASEIFEIIRPNSFEQGELVTKNIQTDPEKGYTSFCYVESCNNCEILNKRIPYLREVYLD